LCNPAKAVCETQISTGGNEKHVCGVAKAVCEFAKAVCGITKVVCGV
jgi:hypothetical protein